MFSFIIQRLGQGIIVILGVSIIVFVVTRIVGDPVAAMLPLEATVEQKAEFARQLGLDRPILTQFRDYAYSLASFDLGQSYWQSRPVSEIIVERFPATLALTLAAMLLAASVAIPMGVLAGVNPGSKLDQLIALVALIGLSVPQFWLGLLLIMALALGLGWLPTSGSGTAYHIILPALTLSLPALARLTMVVRSAVIDEMNQSYVHVAYAKGLTMKSVVSGHVLRNAAIPFVTLFGWELIRALSGYTVVVETVFAWPGLGYAAYQAIHRQDLPLLQGIVVFKAVIVVVLNLAIDITNRAIDPRTKR